MSIVFFDNSLFLDRISPETYNPAIQRTDSVAIPRNPAVPASLALGLQVYARNSTFYLGSGGLNLTTHMSMTNILANKLPNQPPRKTFLKKKT